MAKEDTDHYKHSSKKDAKKSSKEHKHKRDKKEHKHHSSHRHRSSKDRDVEKGKEKKKDSKHSRHHLTHGSSSSSSRSSSRRSEKQSSSSAYHHLEESQHISSDDYFAKNEEFRLWLKAVQKRSFEEMTSTETRDLFEQKFVKDYNKGKLSKMYYSGSIPQELRESVLKTGHKWHFNLSEKEKTKLSDLSEDVSVQTRNSSDLLLGAIAAPAGSAAPPTVGPSIGPSMPPSSAAPPPPPSLKVPSTDNSRGGFDSSVYGHNRGVSNNSTGYGGMAGSSSSSSSSSTYSGNKRHNNGSNRAAYAYASEIVEDLAPDSRHKHAAQRRAGASAALHGAHRAAQDERDGLDMMEDTLLMGGSSSCAMGQGGADDDIRARAAKQAQYKERKQQQMSSHAKELQAKQVERDEVFFAKLGIDPSKGRITIAPRQDPTAN